MAAKNKKSQKRTSKKQRRDYLRGLSHLIAALYWLAKLLFLLWDRFAG
ncbi:MAG: hypothetical protein IKN30_05610 [Synergistaceae bacterium]|nr:hypothetical protein [Synergistaceae bacterium]